MIEEQVLVQPSKAIEDTEDSGSRIVIQKMWLYASPMSTRHRKRASIVLVNFAAQQPATRSLAKPSKEESRAPLPAPIVNASYGKNEEAAKQEIRFPQPQLLCLALL